MNNNNSKGVSYTSGFFILIGLALMATVLAAFASLALLGDVKAMSDPSKAPLLRGIQVGTALLGMFLPALLTAYILSRKPLQLLGYREKINGTQLALIVGILALSLLVATAGSYFTQLIPVPPEWKASFEKLEAAYYEQVAILVNFKNFGGYLFSLFIMAFLPALCEETLFRGGLQNFLSRATHRPWLAIIIVSILFSLAHFSFYLFLPRLVLGAMLGTIYYLTRNLWLSITAHFLNNAVAVTQAYIITLQGKSLASAAGSDDLPTTYWGLLAIPLLVYLFRLLKKSTPPVVTDQTDPYGV